MRRITPHEIGLVATVLLTALGSTGFVEASISIDDRDRLTFVTTKGVRGGLAAIDALGDNGFNTKSDHDMTTNENGVEGAAGGLMQNCWVKIYDIKAPLFKDEESIASLAAEYAEAEAAKIAKSEAPAKDAPGKQTKRKAKTPKPDAGGGGGKDKTKTPATT